MAFAHASLAIVAVGGFIGDAAPAAQLAIYKTNEDWAAVSTSGFFDTAYERLQKGAVILLVLDQDGTPQLRMVLVTASSSSGVTIAQVTNA